MATAANPSPERTRARAEIAALIELLGLRQNADAGLSESRWRLASHELGDAAATVDELRASPESLSIPDQNALRDVRARAAEINPEHAMEEQLLRPNMRTTPSDLARMPERELIRLESEARDVREQRSQATLAVLQGIAQQPLPAGQRYHELPTGWHLQIGGGAAVTALDANTLFIDDRSRWQKDSSPAIAQTAGQMRDLPATGLGDPARAAAPNQRVPLAAVRAWEDSMAAEAHVVNGRGNFRIEEGRGVVTITPQNGREMSFLLPINERPVIAVGFPREAVPGQAQDPLLPRERLAPHDAVRRIRSLLQASNDPAHAVVAAALPSGGTDKSAAEAWIALHPFEAELRARGDAAINAYLDTIKASADWFAAQSADTTRSGGRRILRGDQANRMTPADANSTNSWLIVGVGGTAISAGEVILSSNPNATVYMVGERIPPGLNTNTQWQQLQTQFGPGASPRQRLFAETAVVGSIGAANSSGEFSLNGHTAGGYIAALGRDGLMPEPIANVVYDAYNNDPHSVSGELLFDPLDHRYLGYRVRVAQSSHGSLEFDVTGAASRFLPPELFTQDQRNQIMYNRDTRTPSDIQERDAPEESGNFDGGYQSSARQASRYGQRRREGGL
jgi:hypothetical protein